MSKNSAVKQSWQCDEGRRHEWTCPPHFCQRSFLRLMQIRWVFTWEEGVGYHNYLGFREFAKYGEYSKFAASVGHQKLKGFQLQGALPLTTWPGAFWPWTPLGVPPRPRYRLCALIMRVHPTFFDLATPLPGIIAVRDPNLLSMQYRWNIAIRDVNRIINIHESNSVFYCAISEQMELNRVV